MAHVCAACGEAFEDYGDLIKHYEDKARGPLDLDEPHWGVPSILRALPVPVPPKEQ